MRVRADGEWPNKVHSLQPCSCLVQRCCCLSHAQMNGLQMIVRAHECVMDGFERFAQGHLITLFSATNYCGTANNAGGLSSNPTYLKPVRFA